MTPNMRLFLHVTAIALVAAAILVASQPAEAHSTTPRFKSTLSRATSMRSFVCAHACSSASVNLVISFRPFVAASDANRVACAADLPVTGGAARRAQHQTDLS